MDYADMTSLDPRRSPRKWVAILSSVVVVAGLAAGAYSLAPRFEGERPQVTFAPDTDVLGRAPMEVVVSDRGSGLKSVSATLTVGGSELALAAEQHPTPARERKIVLAAETLAGIKEGPATLRIAARDHSLRGFFRGNETVVEKVLTIDLTPPTVALVADDRYINFGGAGAITYKASADTVRSGVQIGEHFFPGVRGQVSGHPDRFIALFAHPYNVPAQAKAVLVATDKAGNTREVPLAYELKNARYRKSTIFVSDAFVQANVAPLLNDVSAREGGTKEIFLAVNRRLRKENDERISAITSKVTPSVLWKGAFAQLSNSKVEANFADERTYIYQNEPIDRAYHLGYDLSVTKRYPVEAANAGVVAFAGDLGIYGGTVILDHGLGLFTLYSHLSSIDVREGDSLEPLKILGRTGETGLAAGDHLHYGVYVHGVPVLPLEWWDAKWIADNITPKLEGLTSEEIAEAQARPSRKAAQKRRR